MLLATCINYYRHIYPAKYVPPHAVRGFVSFENDLLSGGGGSKELLSAKILLLCAEISCVLSLAVCQQQKARRHTGKNKQVYRKISASWQFSAFVQSVF